MGAVSFANPDFLKALFLVVPLGIEALLRVSALRSIESALRRRVALSAASFIAGILCLIVAASAPSWGKTLAPSLRTGTAASFVFDISHSMTAADSRGGASRLEAAKTYALALLDSLGTVSVSIVIDKGAAAVVMPLSDDRAAAAAIIDALNPGMMSAAGSDIGAGIDAALESFPSALSAAPVILVFTDGDETAGNAAAAASRARERGAAVYFLGFGGPREVAVTTGSGERALTARRIDALKEAAASDLFYLDADDPRSALNLGAALSEGDKSVLVYETVRTERWGVFAGLGVIFFMASVVFSELQRKVSIKTKAPLTLAASLFFLSACGSPVPWKEALSVLEGAMAYRGGDYAGAAAAFFSALDTEESAVRFYALNGLAASYLGQGENAAAMDRLTELAAAENAPAALRFSAAYNRGLLLHRTGFEEEAAAAFREALEVDGGRVEAKVNLEIVRRNAAAPPAASTVMSAAGNADSDAQGAKNALFRVVREQEQQHWRNSTLENGGGSGPDH